MVVVPEQNYFWKPFNLKLSNMTSDVHCFLLQLDLTQLDWFRQSGPGKFGADGPSGIVLVWSFFVNTSLKSSNL